VQSRRQLLQYGFIAGINLGLSACAPTVRLVRNSFQAPSGDKDAFGASAARINALPYATMGVQLREDTRFVAVLATVADQRYTWAAADQSLFVTEHGRLVQTQGLDRDLATTHWLEPDPLIDVARTGAAGAPRVYRTLSLRAGNKLETDVAVESEFAVLGAETLRVLGHTHETVKVRETARIRHWRWSARNFFWIDRSQPVVWLSHQTYCPEMGQIDLQLLKKPTV
jgi:hypothetical protein